MEKEITIQNLPQNTHAKEVQEYFSKYGRIKFLKIMPSFAILQFHHQSSVQKLMENQDDHFFQGKALTIEIATDLNHHQLNFQSHGVHLNQQKIIQEKLISQSDEHQNPSNQPPEEKKKFRRLKRMSCDKDRNSSENSSNSGLSLKVKDKKDKRCRIRRKIKQNQFVSRRMRKMIQRKKLEFSSESKESDSGRSREKKRCEKQEENERTFKH